jgi:hypothetical protein
MAAIGTASLTIAELREFAGFSASERLFIERSLDIGLARCDAVDRWAGTNADETVIRTQAANYRQLRGLRDQMPSECSVRGIEAFMGILIRATAQDLALERLDCFSAYRFLYERLLGAGVRPWLPAAFCGAAALPHIRPERRRLLLQSLSEAAATAPAWSEREPNFFPELVMADAA